MIYCMFQTKEFVTGHSCLCGEGEHVQRVAVMAIETLGAVTMVFYCDMVRFHILSSETWRYKMSETKQTADSRVCGPSIDPDSAGPK